MEKEPKILIIPSKRIDADLLIATYTLARVMKARLGKKVEIGFDTNEISSSLSEIFPEKDLKFIQSIQARSFVINLKNKNAKIKDVKWEEKNGEIKLFISTDHGTISEDAKVRTQGDEYEKIIVLGIQKLEQIGKLYTEYKELFANTEIVNIDLADNNSNFGTDNTFVRPDASSFSELVYEYLNEIGINPAAKEATDLLSGIIWKTKSFQINIQKPSTFVVCAELLNLNGDIFDANKQVFQVMNLSQLRYVNEIIKGIEISSDNIAWSKIYKINMNTLNAKELVFPLSNLLIYLKDVKVSFVLSEISSETTLCDIRSNQKSIKASQIAAAFGKSGTSHHANFVINSHMAEAHKQLLNEIRGIMAGSFPKKKVEAVATKIEEVDVAESDIETEIEPKQVSEEKVEDKTFTKEANEIDEDDILDDDTDEEEFESEDLDTEEDDVEKIELIEAPEETPLIEAPKEPAESTKTKNTNTSNPLPSTSEVSPVSPNVPFDPLPPAKPAA